MDLFLEKRRQMVENQLRGRGIVDERVLEAMLSVPRHLFVPDDEVDFAYEDYPVSIGHGQTVSQPFIVAYMLQAARLRSMDRVLEIGTGLGYQTALLAKLVKEVYSLEVVQKFVETARKKLETLGCANVQIRHANGFEGFLEKAPYDAIIVSAAPKEVPQTLIDQLAAGGRMVIPVGLFSQQLFLVVKHEDSVEKRSLVAVRFVPMVDELF